MSRILLVDDKPENLLYLRTLLEASGHAVETAVHGLDALSKARARRPDAVISDLLMPVMDGYTLLRHWRTDESLRRVPFLVYTATYTEDDDERLALDSGADAFLRKPAEPQVLLAHLRDALARPHRNPEELGTAQESDLLKLYNERLIRKLEKRSLELEEAYRAVAGQLGQHVSVPGEQGSMDAVLLGFISRRTRSATWVLELPARQVHWSPEAARMFGAASLPSPTRLQYLLDRFDAASRSRLEVALEHCLDSGVPAELHATLVEPSGGTRRLRVCIELRSTPLGQGRRLIGLLQEADPESLEQPT